MNNKISVDEIKFLELIKKPCQLQMKNTNILASVIGSIIFHISDGGAKNSFSSSTYNYTKMIADKNWLGKVYHKETNKIYDNISEYDGMESVYKVYLSEAECIEDFVKYLINTRKSTNGPLKYANVRQAANSHKAFEFLNRADFPKNFIIINDQNWVAKMDALVDKLGLVEWDKEVIDNKANPEEKIFYIKKNITDKDSLVTTIVLDDAKKIASENRGYKVFDDHNLVYDPWLDMADDQVYRVRMYIDSGEHIQLLATQDLNEAKEEAAKHEGYKVYAEDDELIYNPWIKSNSENTNIVYESDGAVIKQIVVVELGKEIPVDNTPLYRDAYDKNPMIFLREGPIYIFDTNIINNRVRVSKTNDLRYINGKDPLRVIGFIEVN